MRQNKRLNRKPGQIIMALLAALFFFTVTLPAGTPVFVRTAEAVDKNFTLEWYGNFIHEEVTTVYSPIAGIIDRIEVKKGDFVKSGRFLFAVLRDDPGFTKQKKEIYAPLSGLVKSITAYRGSRISPQSPVLLLAAVDPIYFYAEVCEQDMGKIKPDETVQIKVPYLGEAVTGTVIDFLDVDPARKIARLRIRTANPGSRIAAGSEGKILFTYAVGKVVLIASEAVFVEKGRYFVWVKEGDRAQKKEVRIGLLTDKGFECLSGISAGEEIIYYGYLDLKPGDPVVVVESGNEY